MNWFLLNATGTEDPGNYPYVGAPSWVYYLCGAIFVVLALLSAWYTWRVRDSKREYEHLLDTYGQFKRFWLTYRFPFMILVTIILVICAITFFTLNDVLANQAS